MERLPQCPRWRQGAYRPGQALPHGVAEMSAEIEGFVETSNNLAIVEIKNQELHIVTSQRSSVMSRLAELTGRVEAIAALAGVAVRHTDGYPAWQPDLDFPLLKRSLQVYREVFRSEPVVKTIHAGLECGVLGMKFHDMDDLDRCYPGRPAFPQRAPVYTFTGKGVDFPGGALGVVSLTLKFDISLAASLDG